MIGDWTSHWPQARTVKGPEQIICPTGIIGSKRFLLRKDLVRHSIYVASGAKADADVITGYEGERKIVWGKVKDEKTLTEKRKLVAEVVNALRGVKSYEILLVLEDNSWLKALDAALSALYDYDCFKERDVKNDPPSPKLLLVWTPGIGNAKLESLNHVMRSVFLVRDLVNRPPEAKPPREITDFIWNKLLEAHSGIKVTLLDECDSDFQKMGLVNAVGAASGKAYDDGNPVVLVAEYRHHKAKNKKPIALVGKGVCFDTGGYQVKPSDSMLTMKSDMAGAATVFAVLSAAARMKLPVHLVAAAPFVYNHISSTAYMPDGVYVSYSGKTVEIGHTDAEGRLILADVLSYVVEKYNPELLIDVATLTGACCVALGLQLAGIFVETKDPYADDILKLFMKAAEETGEGYWPLPLYEPYAEQLKSSIANLKNIGNKWGGAITAALFLKQFVGNTPWRHLDIAGPAFKVEEGATGFGVRSILEVLKFYLKTK